MKADGSIKGERRVVTILFADVKGSTGMAESLDPEEVLEIMNGAFEVMIQPILKYEGTLARLMGDAIMAMFGAPIAHEDDAQRACRAALDLLDGARTYAMKLQSEKGISDFNMRVGINTGLVVVGEVGAARRVEYTAMGDAVNVAARMESSAGPGTVLVTESTFRLVENSFAFEPVGPISLKGKSEPVNSYRLLRTSETRHAAGQGIIIGREAQLLELNQAIESVYNGSGGLVSLVGDAGMGKSRIIQEARTRFFRDGKWVNCGAVAYTKGKSYFAARALLYSLAELNDDAQSQISKESLRLMVESLNRSQSAKIVPYLYMLLSGPSGPDDGGLLPNVDPQVMHRRIIRAFALFVRMVAERQPLIIQAEDIQWFDAASINIFTQMFQIAKELPILFILAYRLSGEEISSFHEKHVKNTEIPCRIIELPRLTSEESDLMLGSLSPDIPESLRDDIRSKTEGNPFFIEEVVRQLGETGGKMPSVPHTLRGVIMARLDALPQNEQSTLRAASVLGQSFNIPLIAHLMKETLPIAAINDSLAELRKRGFIKLTRGAEYGFAHSMTQQVVYESILISQLRTLHARAAQAIETVYPDALDEYAVDLAKHYETAGIRERSQHYLVRAARRAASLFDQASAIRFYKQALSYLEESGNPAADLPKLHEALADAHSLSAEYQEALNQYRAAITGPVDSHRSAVLHRKCGMVLERSGRYAEALESFDEALKSLKQGFDLYESARIYNGLARIYYRQEKYDKAIDVGMLALDLMRQLGNNWGIAEATGTLGVAYSALGDLEKGIEFNKTALGIWKIEGEIYGLAAALNNLGWAYRRKGEMAEAQGFFRESISLCEKNDFRHGLASACDNLSQLLVHEGKVQEANMYLQRAVTILSEIGSPEAEPVPELWQQSGTW